MTRVLIAASADGGTFGQVPGLHLRIEDQSTGNELARFDITTATSETAFVFGELYLHASGWKFRAVGQGYDSGLAGLATDYGITVDESPAPSVADEPATSPAPPVGQAPAPPPLQPAGVINLDKGRVLLRKRESVSLTQAGAPPLSKVVMGLGWDPARTGAKVDLDASAIAYSVKGSKLAIVWFMHKEEYRGAVVHSGDNLTGAGDGDDEQIRVDLSALPPDVKYLLFTINSFSGQKFTETKNAYCRLLDGATNAELVRFELSDGEPQTGVLMACLTREPNNTWTMKSLGEFHKGRTAKAMVDPGSKAVTRSS